MTIWKEVLIGVGGVVGVGVAVWFLGGPTAGKQELVTGATNVAKSETNAAQSETNAAKNEAEVPATVAGTATRTPETAPTEENAPPEEPRASTGLNPAFEIPTEPNDQYGIPVKRGTDEKTGWPLEIRHKETEIHLVFIPPGEFQMGSNDGENDEKPVHTVKISKPFYLGKYEVTQAEWQKAMGSNPSHFKHGGNASPVEMVSWDACQEFIRKLNSGVPSLGRRSASGGTKGAGGDGGQGQRFTLPTEAQWEYACRAGTVTRFSFGDEGRTLGEYAWYDKNSEKTPQTVGGRNPNPWGLYDMHGNVREWCADWYGPYSGGAATDPRGRATGSLRVARGGSWESSAADLRSSGRRKNMPSNSDGTLGLRVAWSSP